MHVAPHEDFARIAAGLEACLGRTAAWEGMVYRSAAPRYSGDGDFVTGAGSLGAGTRPAAAGPSTRASIRKPP